MRKKLQALIVNAGTKDVDAMYKAIDVFIEKVYTVGADGQPGDDVGLESLLDLEYDEYMQVVDAILEIVKHDEGMYKAIGASFGRVKLTEEERERLQKKMTEEAN